MALNGIQWTSFLEFALTVC